MADTKISDMTDVGTLASGDAFPIADASALTTNKYATMAEVITFLQTANGLPRVASLSSAYTNSTVNATKVTGLDITSLAAGNYVAVYYLMIQNATAANGCDLSVNFTGTATGKVFYNYLDAGTTAVTPSMDDAGAAGQIVGGASATNFSNAATQMTVTTFATAGTNTYMQVTVVFNVTVSGNLELYAKSQSTTQAQVSVGSSVIVTRVG